MTVLHGPVPLASNDYAERVFEIRLIQELQAGHWVLVLGPRQHGKTSALLRVQEALRGGGMSVALVDLQRLPPVPSYASLVGWFASSVSISLGVATPVEDYTDVFDALEHVAPPGNAPVTVLIDEASNIANSEWRNAFFGQIRAISSQRGAVPEGHLARRLRFAFAGTFRPEQLVAEANSPFNVCERVETDDLTLDKVTELCQLAGVGEVQNLAQSIFSEVGGQPYLVQRLLANVQGRQDEPAALSSSIEELRLGQSDHITNLFRKVLNEPVLRDIVAAVVAAGSVPVQAGNDDHKYLTVLGILKVSGNQLVFRNRLYATIAANSPQFGQVPGGGQAPRAVIFPLPEPRFTKVADIQLREIAFEAQRGAVASYNAGSQRLALAGFGTAMEAVLLDFLKRQSAQQIATASGECKNTGGPWYDAANPETWSLADMMRGARKLTQQNNLDIPENLREWRNAIHPSVAIKNFQPDAALGGEVYAGIGLVDILLRDLP